MAEYITSPGIPIMIGCQGMAFLPLGFVNFLSRNEPPWLRYLPPPPTLMGNSPVFSHSHNMLNANDLPFLFIIRAP